VTRQSLPENAYLGSYQKRNKKLLLDELLRLRRAQRNQKSKSFLVLFFKKELLSSGTNAPVATIRRLGHHALQTPGASA
jgi:hypothetical protein